MRLGKGTYIKPVDVTVNEYLDEYFVGATRDRASLRGFHTATASGQCANVSATAGFSLSVRPTSRASWTGFEAPKSRNGKRTLPLDDELGIPLHPESYSDEFTRMLKRGGLPKIRLHDSRHTTLSLMEKAGVPISVIS
jgi:hypothetical protein